MQGLSLHLGNSRAISNSSQVSKYIFWLHRHAHMHTLLYVSLPSSTCTILKKLYVLELPI